MSLEESNTYVIRTCSNRSCRLEAFVPAEWQFCASCGLRFRDADGGSGGKRRKVVPHPADPPAPTSQQQMDNYLAKKKEIYGVSSDGSPAKPPPPQPHAAAVRKAYPTNTKRNSPHRAKRNGKRPSLTAGGGGAGATKEGTTGFLPQIMSKLHAHLSHREEIARVVREQLALARILEMKNAAQVTKQKACSRAASQHN